MTSAARSAERCPEALPDNASVYTRTLHRACAVAGSVLALADELDAPVVAVFRWLDGLEDPPLEIFLKAVDFALLRVPPAAND